MSYWGANPYRFANYAGGVAGSAVEVALLCVSETSGFLQEVANQSGPDCPSAYVRQVPISGLREPVIIVLDLGNQSSSSEANATRHVPASSPPQPKQLLHLHRMPSQGWAVPLCSLAALARGIYCRQLLVFSNQPVQVPPRGALGGLRGGAGAGAGGRLSLVGHRQRHLPPPARPGFTITHQQVSSTLNYDCGQPLTKVVCFPCIVGRPQAQCVQGKGCGGWTGPPSRPPRDSAWASGSSPGAPSSPTSAPTTTWSSSGPPASSSPASRSPPSSPPSPRSRGRAARYGPGLGGLRLGREGG